MKTNQEQWWFWKEDISPNWTT